MKRKGSRVEYAQERNREIFILFRKIHSEGGLSRTEVCRRVANSPASRFWVSEERATYVISAMNSGRPLPRMHENREAMFGEIFRRFKIEQGLNPRRKISEIVGEIIHQRAPLFYLTTGSVGIFYHLHCKLQRRERKVDFTN